MEPGINPYASPAPAELNPVAVQWLEQPSVSLSRVALGLGLKYVAIIVMLLGTTASFLLPALFISRIGPDLVGFYAILGGVLLLAALLDLVGDVCCLATPQETGAQGLVYAAVGTIGLAILISLVNWLLTLPPAFGVINILLNVASGVLFVLFMRKLALFIGREDLASNAVTTLVTWGAVVMLALLYFSWMYAATQGAPHPPGSALPVLFLLIFLLAPLYAFIRYANLLTYMRKAILRAQTRT